MSLCTLLAAGVVHAQPPAVAAVEPAVAPSVAGPMLSCAVEWQNQAPEPDALCAALGRELGRPVQRVSDARTVKRGDAVQLFSTDVHWIVVFLRNGHPAAWTRVSKALTQGKELASLSRIARTLSRERTSERNACVRVEPSTEGTAHTTDLVYPWAELRRCKRKVREVADPWSAR